MSSVFVARVDRHQVGGPAGVNDPAATPAVASRLVTSEARDRIHRGQAGPGAIGDGGREAAVAHVGQHAHLAGQLVGDDQVGHGRPDEIRPPDIGDAQADGMVTAGEEGARSRLQHRAGPRR